MPPTGGGRKEHMSTDVSRVSVQVGREEITLETGKLAKQASGAVVVTQGETMVLATATAGNTRDVDFLPLTVDVEERMYAAGKIPGSFFKREGRAGEKGTLTARMIDRPIRPLFPKGWRRETQLVAIPMSVDHVNPYDVLAMNVASAEEAILMVEAGAREVSEAVILDALDIAHAEIKKLCALQRELAEKAGKPKAEVEVPQVDESVLSD